MILKILQFPLKQPVIIYTSETLEMTGQIIVQDITKPSGWFMYFESLTYHYTGDVKWRKTVKSDLKSYNCIIIVWWNENSWSWIDFFSSLNNGTIQLETEKVTKLILKDAKASCSDELKADSEALFIDPITRNGYTIQKIRERNNARNPIIFKVGWKLSCIWKIMLKK